MRSDYCPKPYRFHFQPRRTSRRDRRRAELHAAGKPAPNENEAEERVQKCQERLAEERVQVRTMFIERWTLRQNL